MSKFVTRQARCLVGAYDYSGDCKAIGLDYSANMVDVTNLQSTGKEKLPGYLDWKASYSGYLSTGSGLTEEANFAYIGQNHVPILLTPTSGADGDVAYFGQSTAVSYATGTQVGDAMPFNISAEGQDRLIRGSVLKIGTVTADGNGAALSLGSVAAGKHLYGQLHVFSAAGTTPSITVKIQSDDNDGFETALDQIVFSTKSARGYQWAVPVSGPNADTFWRATWTVEGTTPVFGIAVVMGIM